MLGRGDGGETDGCFGGGDLVGLVKLGCEVAYPLRGKGIPGIYSTNAQALRAIVLLIKIPVGLKLCPIADFFRNRPVFFRKMQVSAGIFAEINFKTLYHEKNYIDFNGNEPKCSC